MAAAPRAPAAPAAAPATGVAGVAATAAAAAAVTEGTARARGCVRLTAATAVLAPEPGPAPAPDPPAAALAPTPAVRAVTQGQGPPEIARHNIHMMPFMMSTNEGSKFVGGRGGQHLPGRTANAAARAAAAAAAASARAACRARISAISCARRGLVAFAFELPPPDRKLRRRGLSAPTMFPQYVRRMSIARAPGTRALHSPVTPHFSSA